VHQMCPKRGVIKNPCNQQIFVEGTTRKSIINRTKTRWKGVKKRLHNQLKEGNSKERQKLHNSRSPIEKEIKENKSSEEG